MTVRTQRSTVVFRQPFNLSNIEGTQPAGEYLVETDEESIEGLSRVAFRRLSTYLHLPSTGLSALSREVLSVNQVELDAALMKDRGETC